MDSYTSRWLLLVFAIIIVIILFMWNQQDIDCIDDMPCKSMSNTDNAIDRLYTMSSIPVWRQALITAIIVTIPLMFVYRKDIPTLWDWLIVVPFVFLISYFSYSWIMYHFYQPNIAIIVQELQKNKK